MNLRPLLIAAAVAIGSTFTVAASAGPIGHETGPDLVTNGGFETGDFTGWSAAVDPDFSGVDGPSAHTGNFGAFFGDVGAPGSISQALATVAGGSYNIHLWIRNDGLTPNSFEVLWGGASVYSVADLGAFAYTEIVIDPLATGASTTLTLLARNDNGFLEVDDISVRLVPEPDSLALVAPMLLGAVVWRRRKT